MDSNRGYSSRSYGTYHPIVYHVAGNFEGQYFRGFRGFRGLKLVHESFTHEYLSKAH